MQVFSENKYPWMAHQVPYDIDDDWGHSYDAKQFNAWKNEQDPQDLISVFRVEHTESGRGMFTHLQADASGHKVSELFGVLAADNGLKNFPDPEADGFGFMVCNLKFGCITLDSLKKWLSLTRDQDVNRALVNKLHELGFVVKEYLVPVELVSIGNSGIQVAWNIKQVKAQSIDLVSQSYSLMDFLKYKGIGITIPARTWLETFDGKQKTEMLAYIEGIQ